MQNIKKEISTKIDLIKSLIQEDISDNLLVLILFEMGRYFDREFVEEIKRYQQQSGRIFNQNERNLLRQYYYYKNDVVLAKIGISGFGSIVYTDSDVVAILDDCTSRCNTYGSDKIISSIKERQFNQENDIIGDNSNQWLSYYQDKVREKYKYSAFILNIDQADFEQHNYSIDAYCNIISSIYAELENYRHLFIVIKGTITDSRNIDQTWNLIYKLGLYCENFVKFEEKFTPFKKEKSKEKLAQFLDERFPENDNQRLVDDFYSAISTGFKYEDCFIGEQQGTIVLSYKKIALDNDPVPCPSCMTTIQQSNSFPEMFLRSYECKNPRCKDRSKSGRGKRFDEFGTYRYCRLIENKECNQISYDMYEKWRRDIFSEGNDIYEMIIKYYTWGGETVCFYADSDLASISRHDRNVVRWSYADSDQTRYHKDFESLPIVVLLKNISKLLNHNTGNERLSDRLNVFHDDSTNGIRNLQPGQIGCAITSPPYYNAREYSQWQTLVMYLVDMMINASAVYDSLQEDGFYLYNIGDVVNFDNIYVESNMSKRRLQLGFLSCMFFELLGFNLIGNIIWDKGEVQSKRNSTINLNSGYVKCINCYEHVFILKKGSAEPGEVLSKVSSFSPVIKINSKGINTYKHTAPYPLEMVDLLKPFLQNAHDKYILDPFLGSGTTLIWCKRNNFKGVGFELNKEYFELCKSRIFSCDLFDM